VCGIGPSYFLQKNLFLFCGSYHLRASSAVNDRVSIHSITNSSAFLFLVHPGDSPCSLSAVNPTLSVVPHVKFEQLMQQYVLKGFSLFMLREVC